MTFCVRACQNLLEIGSHAELGPITLVQGETDLH